MRCKLQFVWFIGGALACACFSQATTVPARFEVADVHRSPQAGNPQTYRSGGFLRGERYDLRKATMLDLIRLAYGYQPEVVFGGPDWLEIDRFDIAAKAPASTGPDDLTLMLQALLAERFHLTFHKEERPMPAFALRLSGGQSKMKAAAGGDEHGCVYQPQPNGSIFSVYSCRAVTMDEFAQQLRNMAGDYLRDPVVNVTGIDGRWDFELQWNGRSRLLPEGVERITIFDAVSRQLALKLAIEKAPGMVVVIDRVDERPTANVGNIEALLPPRELQFEVASVKECDPAVRDGFSGGDRSGFEAHCESMRNLFATAWDVHWDHVDELVRGMPKWMDSARYDILAKPARTGGTAPPLSSFIDDDMRQMLRALLTDRFGVRTHSENRPVEAYALVAAKPRLRKALSGVRANCKEAQTVADDPRDRNPRLSRLLQCQNVTIAEFAEQLLPLSANDFAYPVVDATGIAGRWDLLLSFTPTGDRREPARSLLREGSTPGEPSGAMSIFEAVNRQLGLRLVQRKRLLPVLVIDQIEQKPREN